MGIDEEIARYLSTGDHDMTFAARSGGWFNNTGAEDLKAALVSELGCSPRRGGPTRTQPCVQ